MLKAICLLSAVMFMNLSMVNGVDCDRNQLYAIHFGPGPDGDQGENPNDNSDEEAYVIHFGPGQDGNINNNGKENKYAARFNVIDRCIDTIA